MALADKVNAFSLMLRQSGPGRAIAEIQTVRMGETSPYWVRVLDSTSRVLGETSGMSAQIPVNQFPTPPSADRAQRDDYRSANDLFSLVSAQVQGHGTHYLLQIAQNRTGDERFNHQVRLLFLATLATSIVAASVVAWTTATGGLQPLQQISEAFKRVGPTHLHDRVGVVPWPRELQPLAEAFDQMLARLEESFSRLSQFSADLAHELRTPITNMLGAAQVALSRDRTAAEYREAIESNVAECERLSRITDSLLFLARTESAREQLKLTIVDARALIDKVASFYQTIADDRKMTIRCEGRGEVQGDPLLLTRALSNLVENAMRFTADGGKIGMTISRQSRATVISVSDNGSGIPAEHLPRVFDRFYTADPSRSSGGTGLGLALVKSIVELHGGAAAVQSDPGRGTVVTLRFPDNAVTDESGAQSAPNDYAA